MRSISIALLVMLCASPALYASDFYEWRDVEGATHFATSLEQVPEKYRDQVKSPERDQKAWATEFRVTTGPSRDESPSAVDDENALLRFEVPYKAREGSAKRVIIPVTLNDAVTAQMAIDTGAPGMVLSVELAEKLGVFSRDQGTLIVLAAGIGGATPAIRTIIDAVAVEGARDLFVPTTVTAGLSQEFEGLIGMDFLSNYTVHIDSKKQVVVFQQNPPSPDSRGGHDEEWWRKNFKEFHAAYDDWRAYAESVRDRPGARTKALAEFQLRAAERLFRRLDVYASDNAVPRHWR